MFNKCQRIADFYQSLRKDDTNGDFLSHETTGPFNGKTFSYTIPTDIGAVKIRCDNGVNTLGVFNHLEILLIGSVKGRLRDSTGSVGSEGSKWLATDISEISASGECHVKTLFTNAVVKFPLPIQKK